jgi:carboxyl-terminal processing protease
VRPRSCSTFERPGGLVDQAIDVASTFIPEGVVYIREDADGQQIPVKVTDVPRTDLPMVVLVDFGSASSAEIVTGALQDQGRAKVIGTQTYGTGTVLNEFSLDGSALRLGVERWPRQGPHIFPAGIKPDIQVPLETDVLPSNRRPGPDVGRCSRTATHSCCAP